MKALIFCMTLLGTASALAADYTCYSPKNAPVYYSNAGQWILEFSEGPHKGVVTGVSLSTKVSSQVGSSEDSLEADEKFKPRNKKYADYDRYGLADPWCDYMILLPRDPAAAGGRFQGHVYFLCDGGSRGNFSLLCLAN